MLSLSKLWALSTNLRECSCKLTFISSSSRVIKLVCSTRAEQPRRRPKTSADLPALSVHTPRRNQMKSFLGCLVMEIPFSRIFLTMGCNWWAPMNQTKKGNPRLGLTQRLHLTGWAGYDPHSQANDCLGAARGSILKSLKDYKRFLEEVREVPRGDRDKVKEGSGQMGCRVQVQKEKISSEELQKRGHKGGRERKSQEVLREERSRVDTLKLRKRLWKVVRTWQVTAFGLMDPTVSSSDDPPAKQASGKSHRSGGSRIPQNGTKRSTSQLHDPN